ncbi:hypothetical protein HQN60_15895 (plasmid) [Deefgea piscis]|uniref:Uncharacterized protein n=1 Tax=Deefgea piscis TaxID=2739061 RepID=A0A6M8SW84_9NEIS|nr:hypothetical protein [Deefgea piscis]QKJ68308.1 hypothetical protein HQN60_15895 [Deefgea piscis]
MHKYAAFKKGILPLANHTFGDGANKMEITSKSKYKDNITETNSQIKRESSENRPNITTLNNIKNKDSSIVSISGNALMISRLFDGKSNTPIASGKTGTALINSGVSNVNYLNSDDRELLAEMYQFANNNGVDLQNVDAIAQTLGSYRRFDDGRNLYNFNNGHNMDTNGNVLSVNFSEKDSKTASRIINGEAINTTRIDHGFLKFILDPGYGALMNTTDLEFLEQMTTKFSEKGTNITKIDEKFSKFSPTPREKITYTRTGEKIDILNNDDINNIVNKSTLEKISENSKKTLIRELMHGKTNEKTQQINIFDLLKNFTKK